MQPRAPLTQLLDEWSRGHATAGDDLFDQVYPRLHRLALSMLCTERAHHTLQPGNLVHEAYRSLDRRRKAGWCDRKHFFATAAQSMRRVLIDHERRRRCVKRGAGEVCEALPDDPADRSPRRLGPATLVDLRRALERLATFDPRQARIVELRYFCGHTIAETAAHLGCSPATVERQWLLARGFLLQQLAGASADSGR